MPACRIIETSPSGGPYPVRNGRGRQPRMDRPPFPPRATAPSRSAKRACSIIPTFPRRTPAAHHPPNNARAVSPCCAATDHNARRRIEAKGEPYVEPGPARLINDRGRTLSSADVLRARCRSPSSNSFFDVFRRLHFHPLSFTPAVPEPGTCATMMAGLALLGFGVRRRRKPPPLA
jgi:PEP-CTERM motif